MANRPVYMCVDWAPYTMQWTAEFNYNSGFAVSQKQKNILAIHEEFTGSFPGKRVLEISSKSLQEEGEALSAFFLPKFVPSLGRSVPVECAYQAGKVFKLGGPYTDLLEATPRAAKRDSRLKESGALTGFTFDVMSFPLTPKTLFYDYLYINALLENEELAKRILTYDAFTDIEFNPAKSVNCQARAAAMFVSLVRLGKIDQVRDPESFRKLYY